MTGCPAGESSTPAPTQPIMASATVRQPKRSVKPAGQRPEPAHHPEHEDQPARGVVPVERRRLETERHVGEDADEGEERAGARAGRGEHLAVAQETPSARPRRGPAPGRRVRQRPPHHHGAAGGQQRERHERRPPADRRRGDATPTPPEQSAGDERGEVVAHRAAAEARPEHLHHVERADGQQARQDQPLQRPGTRSARRSSARCPQGPWAGPTSALAQMSVRRRPQRSDSGPRSTRRRPGRARRRRP